MTAEPFTFRIAKDGDFDGVTPIVLRRDDFTVTGQRYYQKNIIGPAGVIDSDFFGLFQDASPKLVGLASASPNPLSSARVLIPGTTMSQRQEISLRPAMQYVTVYPGDKLALRTADGTRAEVVLVVNELTEHDHLQSALRNGPQVWTHRLRIIRETGGAFSPGAYGDWHPTFAFDVGSDLVIARDNGIGAIPVADLCLRGPSLGAYVTIRYANSAGTGSFQIVDQVTRKPWIAQTNLTDVKWAKSQFVSHDDLIALNAVVNAAGGKLVADIEVVQVHPRSRQIGRFGNDMG